MIGKSQSCILRSRYTDYGTYTMEIWLAFRDAISLVTPFEDLIMDGMPVADDGTSPVQSTSS